MRLIATTIAGVLAQAIAALGQCFSDPATNTEWAQLINVPSPAIGFGIAIMSSIALYELVGVACFFFIKGKSENFLWRAHFACMGKIVMLHLFWRIVTATLAASAIDSNAILGTAMLSYKYSFWDGAVLPIGLGLSLILNALFFARKINVDRALTLPDVYAKRYGKVVEIMISICTIISFICLLAGNLVGMGTIISYCLSISKKGAIWLSASLVWSYTVAGGLFSVAATDIFQSAIGWTGCMVLAFYLIKNEESAPPASIGFPGYVYPDESICDMYDGVPCSNNSTQCCYNEELWCPSPDNCRVDNGAYPFGDQRKFSNQMTDPYALTPFPNAIMFNWATIFVLGFGNLAALDFQARCMASRTPKVATVSCLIAGCLTFAVGIPYGYLGPLLGFITDLTVQEPNSRQILAMPFLAFQRADSGFQMLTLLLNFSQTKRPHFLAAAASGAILAMGTVFSHNILRNLGSFLPCVSPSLVTDKNLLRMARVITIPFAAIAAFVAIYYHSNHSLGATGYLLIVAFDVVLASAVVPLFGCFYTKKPSPLAAFCSILAGVFVRVFLEFTLPKDGFVILPYPGEEFLNYGPAASTLYPPFFDKPQEELWDPTASGQECDQIQYNDWTGVDSLAAPIAAAVVFISVQWLERNGPIFDFKEDGVMCGYLKTSQQATEVEDDKLGKDASVTVRETVIDYSNRGAHQGDNEVTDVAA
ncbi:hypothetical protein HJC23_001250 [Cyclotella cryptica]|uniref:Uncharacterized protein n=1 Tax=Cyclotella cryptica TaxID=29204 RepID=A0ABD3NTA6_9STRA